MLALGTTSCEEFLDRPAEDNYNAGNFYQNDEQCYQGVNYLYNSPWYDFQRGFIKVGEVLSGNMYWGSSPYMEFTVNGTDADLVSMSYSLWAAIGHAILSTAIWPSLIFGNCKASVHGECLTWKAWQLSIWFVPLAMYIIHSIAEEMAMALYNQKMKVRRADVDEYIIMTLEKAIELLSPSVEDPGRIDRYCAKALLAKVYLTRCGLSGARSAEDLAKAAEYAKDVIDNSGRKLLENIRVFPSGEQRKRKADCLAQIRAVTHGAQNTLQSDWPW
jgi:hypothetical protein